LQALGCRRCPLRMDGTFCAHVLLVASHGNHSDGSHDQPERIWRSLLPLGPLESMPLRRDIRRAQSLPPNSGSAAFQPRSRGLAWLDHSNRLDGLFDVTLTLSQVLDACTCPRVPIRSAIESCGCPMTGGFVVDFEALITQPLESREAVLDWVEPDLLDRGCRAFGPQAPLVYCLTPFEYSDGSRSLWRAPQAS